MNKVRKKFVLYAMISLFVLLTILVGVINVINFSMASNDADMITQTLAKSRGEFAPEQGKPLRPGGPGGRDLWGPDSPETHYSVRYFTFAFDEDGNAQKIAFNISAFTEDEARELAQSLVNEKTGWTSLKYRYRVYKESGLTYVTVIDQGRELLPSYRILLISVFGEIVGLLIGFAFLMSVSKKLFRPLEEADRRQKAFLTEAENKFKVPLTVISADAELIEKENGQSDYTTSINRQVRRMTSLVRELGELALYDTEKQRVDADVSSILTSAAEEKKTDFATAGKALETAIDTGVRITGDENSLRRAVREMIDNAYKYSVSRCALTLRKSDGRATLICENDCTLPDGEYDRVFDRFTVLENADPAASRGLGLSFVREVVKQSNGRASAYVRNGVFTLKITF